MKKMRFLAIVLAALMCLCVVSCDKSDDDGSTPTGDNTSVKPITTTTVEDITTTEQIPDATTTVPDDTTTVPDDTTTEPITDATTTAEEPEEPKVPEEGLLVYYENFDVYETWDFDLTNKEHNYALFETIKWRQMTIADDKVDGSTEPDTYLAIKDGRLHVSTYTKDPSDTRVIPTHNFLAINDLNDAVMDQVSRGSYTLQYDLCFIMDGIYDNSKWTTFAGIALNLNGPCRTDYVPRICGDAFFEYVTNETGTPATKHLYDESATSTTNSRAIGSYGNVACGIEIAKSRADMRNVPFSIKVQVIPGEKITVYAKSLVNPDSEFIKVTETDPESAGYNYWLLTEDNQVAFHSLHGLNCWIDNIALWTGVGDMPQKTVVDFVPET